MPPNLCFISMTNRLFPDTSKFTLRFNILSLKAFLLFLKTSDLIYKIIISVEKYSKKERITISFVILLKCSTILPDLHFTKDLNNSFWRSFTIYRIVHFPLKSYNTAFLRIVIRTEFLFRFVIYWAAYNALGP